MDLIFTDLDGTLLDRDTYAWEAAQPALDQLRRQGIPWVLVTSKTRAEVEFWRARLKHEHPFIVENGGAAFIPAGYFPFAVPAGNHQGSYVTMEWGTPYPQLVAALQRASQASQCRVRGFHEMTPEEVATLCALPLEQAVLARQREYDEPFLVLDPDRAPALTAAIEAQGRQWTRGGRFWHILGPNDKALAVTTLADLYRQRHGSLRSIGLGDALNDVSFLNAVAVPVLIHSPQAAELKRAVPHGLLTDHPGPAGWNQALLALVGQSQVAPE